MRKGSSALPKNRKESGLRRKEGRKRSVKPPRRKSKAVQAHRAAEEARAALWA